DQHRGAQGDPPRDRERRAAGAGDGAPIACVERDDFSSNRCVALAYWWRMIFSENRYPLFGIMRWPAPCVVRCTLFQALLHRTRMAGRARAPVAEVVIAVTLRNDCQHDVGVAAASASLIGRPGRSCSCQNRTRV